MQDLIRDMPEPYWRNQIYGGWLQALTKLDRDLTVNPTLPQVFRTEAWRTSSCRLSSVMVRTSSRYHSLRQTAFFRSLLRSTSGVCRALPEFFSALEQVARRAAEELEPIVAPVARRSMWGPPPQAKHAYSEFFLKMAGHLTTLESRARKLPRSRSPVKNFSSSRRQSAKKAAEYSAVAGSRKSLYTTVGMQNFFMTSIRMSGDVAGTIAMCTPIRDKDEYWKWESDRSLLCCRS